MVAERNAHTNQTTVYKYDEWGNIAKKWLYSGSGTFTPASANLIKEYDYVYSSSTDMAWKDLMTKYDGKTITYDAIGNPTSYMGSTMYWYDNNHTNENDTDTISLKILLLTVLFTKS